VHPKIDSKQTTPPKANTSYQVLGLVRVWKPIALLLEIDYGKQRVQRVNECLEPATLVTKLKLACARFGGQRVGLVLR
jgi:hypothetical protein